MDIKKLKSLSNNKLIFEVDLHFQRYFQKIIKNTVWNYRGIPETIEGIYWEFMFEIPKIMKEFKGEDWQHFRIYAGRVCYFFTKNRCRFYTSRNFEVMNNFHSFDDLVIANEDLNHLSDITIDEPIEVAINEVDTSILNEVEAQVFEAYFLKNERIATISRNFSITRHNVVKVLKCIHIKLHPKSQN